MKILGVTGSMGMGKSTVCSMLHKEGFPVFDADQVVHQLQSPYGKALPYLAQLFPNSVINGCLDRQVLRNMIQQNPHNLHKIEQIILPLVAQERDSFLRLMQRRNVKWCILDIPLLFEKKINQICTKTLVVDAPYAIQKWRIVKRGQISWEQAKFLIAQQIPNYLKCQWADIVVHTGLNKAHTFMQVKRFVYLMKQGKL